jgi:eukaryotic-like serine/threonine-protein kinase
LTAKKDWKPPQRKMMRKATRYHAGRGIVLALLLGLLGMTGWESFGRVKAYGLRDRLLNASTADVPVILADMAPYRRWVDPLLRGAVTDEDARKQLHVSLALLRVDATQVEYLYGRLLDAEPHEVPVIRDFLAPHADELLDRLWAVVETPDKGKESQRLRAAAGLAKYDP